MKLTILGTGNAMVTRCYNTCFALSEGEDFLLVDAGGGNGILRQMADASLAFSHLHHLFLTHAHTDHLLGVVCPDSLHSRVKQVELSPALIAGADAGVLPQPLHGHSVALLEFGTIGRRESRTGLECGQTICRERNRHGRSLSDRCYGADQSD